jgi:hypothetical protein
LDSKDIADPFVTHTVKVSLLDTLRGLLRGGVRVQVRIDGKNLRIIEDVMELDDQYLGYNCTRRDDFDKQIAKAIKSMSTLHYH